MTAPDVTTSVPTSMRLLAGLEDAARLDLDDHVRVHGAVDDAVGADAAARRSRSPARRERSATPAVTAWWWATAARASRRAARTPG
jgi:hypothetical protein